MTITNFPKKQPKKPAFFSDIKVDGYSRISRALDNLGGCPRIGIFSQIEAFTWIEDEMWWPCLWMNECLLSLSKVNEAVEID